MTIMQKLSGKNVLITGGNSGIGLAAAKLFLEQGARVAITGRDPQALDEAAKALGHDVLALCSDAASVADIEALMSRIAQQWGRIDVLFVNAAIASPAPFELVSEAHFDSVMLHPTVPRLEGTGPHAELGARRIGCALRDDVDDARKCIGPIQRRPWPPDDLDARDVLQRQTAPYHAAVAHEQRGHRHTVLEHKRLRVEIAVDAADGVQRRVGLRIAAHMDAGHRLQHLVEVGRAHGGDVLGSDHGGHRWRPSQRLPGAGGDAHRGFVSVQQRGIFFVCAGRSLCMHCGAQQADCRERQAI